MDRAVPTSSAWNSTNAFLVTQSRIPAMQIVYAISENAVTITLAPRWSPSITKYGGIEEAIFHSVAVNTAISSVLNDDFASL